MADFKDNTGVLFKNDRKQSANHPDYQGNATADGVEYWLSAWIKDGKNGKFMSLSFKKKEQPASVPQGHYQKERSRPADDSFDVPF